jgi:hypothetical protein
MRQIHGSDLNPTKLLYLIHLEVILTSRQLELGIVTRKLREIKLRQTTYSMSTTIILIIMLHG